MLYSRCLPNLLAIAVLTLPDIAYSSDWAMWRHDAQRSGASPAVLADDLHLQWTRQLPSPLPAWPNEARLHFDASYEPVVLGSRMFVGSMVDGSLTAFDCKNGRELWRFYSNGPVRLAPVAFNDCVCFGSDDGWLYCLNAESGELIWKVCGAPKDRGQFRHLGNARLISYWPVRGGPVVKDGVVYFGAGIWPTLGVFVHAVDAKSGRVIWTNDDSHAIANVRVDHNYLQESGISPQGHMLLSGDMLIVPNGRSMPARLDRKTGQLHYFVQGYRNGDSRVTAAGDIALVGLTGVVSLKDGREVASRWAAAGKDAPEGWSSPKVDLFEGPLFPYKFSPGLDYRSVVDGAVAYGIHDGTVYCYDLKRASDSLYDKQFNGKDISPARWDAPELWKVPTEFAGKKLATNSLILAGNRLYGHCGRNLISLDVEPNGASPRSPAWTKELSAEPTSILAAHGRLFVVTNDGSIHCFGAESVDLQKHELMEFAEEDQRDEWTPIAKAALDAADCNDGYAVVIGLETGRIVEELMGRSRLRIVAVDDDEKIVNRLRRRYSGHEDYVTRFQGIVEDPATAVLPPYLARLIVTEDLDRLRPDAGTRLPTLFDTLRPYGGTMCLPRKNAESGNASLAVLSTDRCAGAKVDDAGPFVRVRRIGPLPGSSVWSHETGDAARSFYSRDENIRAPLAVLWYGDGRDHGFHKRKDYGHGLKPQVAGGRLVALQVATNTLKSVDAYTGQLLWSQKVGGSARYASMPDAVYVADERMCLVLNAQTGELRKSFPIDVSRPDDVPVSASDIRLTEDVILIAVRFNKENAISKGRWNSELLIALDRASGKQLWSRPAEHRYNTAAIAAGSGRVFCIDSHSPEEIGVMRRRGKEVEGLPSTIFALDELTGDELWKVVREDTPASLATLHFMSLRTQDDWLSYSVDHDLVVAGKGNQTFSLNASTGDVVWEKAMRGQQPLILGPETFINQTGHTYHVADGELVSGTPLFRRGGCNYAVGGANLLFLRSNCATYVDVESRQEYAIRNLRSGCSNSLVAADGLLNAPCFSVGCVCNYPIQTSFAMFHLPQAASWHGSSPMTQNIPRDEVE